jgi:hypothetical protein
VTNPSIDSIALEASVFNGTEYYIKNVRILVILHPTSIKNDPVDYMTIEVENVIPPHLAKRFSALNYSLSGHGDFEFLRTKERWVASFRVLDYEIIKNDAADFGIPR